MSRTTGQSWAKEMVNHFTQPNIDLRSGSPMIRIPEKGDPVKLASILTLALTAYSAGSFATQLKCAGSTLSLGKVQSIEINNESIIVTTGSGKFDGEYDSSISQYLLHAGAAINVPADLLDGKTQLASVSISTYDYPYESVTCSF